MSHKKKTSALSECVGCGLLFLSRDQERHWVECSNLHGLRQLPANAIGVIPGVLLSGTAQQVDVAADMPEGLAGWQGREVLFLNSASLKALGISPRQPCLVEVADNDGPRVVLPWPCDQLSALRLWHREIMPESRVTVRVASRIARPALISFRMADSSLLVDEGFEEFLSAYLRGAFLLPGSPVLLEYCGRLLTVVPDSTEIEDNLQNLSLDSSTSPTVLEVTPKCAVVLLRQQANGAKGHECEGMTFDEVPGLEETKKVLRQFLVEPITSGRCPCSIVVHGVAGSGKSLLLHSLQRSLHGLQLFSSLRELEKFAPFLSSTIVLALDVNDLPEDKQHSTLAAFTSILNKGVTVVMAVRSLDVLPLSLRVRFPLEVEMCLPVEAERALILKNLLASLTSEEAASLASETHAFTPSDLVSLVRLAESGRNEEEELFSSLQRARRRIQPTGMREFTVEVPSVSWADVAGNHELKEEIQQAVMWPLSHSAAFSRFGVAAPSGILLYGPPGCSKTLIARALANESRRNFISVKGPELFSKWVGDSEKAIRHLFARARQMSPSLVFFDELDAVGQARGQAATSGVGDRVLAQLLTELDGLESNDGVLILAATNRPDQLDSALLRPGRLDRVMYVSLPCAETRRAILSKHLSRLPLSEDPLEWLISQTEGYSGAEIVALAQTAALSAMREDLTGSVTPSHFECALKDVRPRTPRHLIDIYEKFMLGNR